MKKQFLTVLALLAINTAFAQHECALAKMNSGGHQPVVSSAHVDLENMYDARFHQLNLNVERTSKAISGNVRTLATVTATALDTFAFELYNTNPIDSVIINGTRITPLRKVHEVRVPLAASLPQGSTIDATIYYHGTPPTINGASYGDGLNNTNSMSWGNQVTFSLSESYSAYEWWPSKQQLQDKLDSAYVFVTTDSTNKVGSNGILTNTVVVGNKKRYEWKERHVIDYYLISVAVAQYIDYRGYAHPAGMTDSILVQNYIYNNPSTLSYFKTVIDQTPSLVELFSDLYGLYPFADEKYGHSMAPLGGGMEHQTMTTLGSFSMTLIAHELGHQWFGDNATCRTWHDIFVNEGFATYSEQLALEHLDPTNAYGNMMNIHQNVMSSPGGSVYNPDTTNQNRIFDSRLSYDKGAGIIHSIRFIINNDSLFFASLQNYQSQFHNNTASIDDFKTSIENTSGINFTQFFNQWIYGEGYPTFNIRWNQTGNSFTFRSTETVSMSSVTPLFITPMEYKLVRSIGDTIIKVNQNQAVENYTFPIRGTVTKIIIDPHNWIINDSIGPTKDITLVGIHNYDVASENIRIYPNPAKDKVFIDVPATKEYYINLYDITGKLISSQNYTGNGTLNISAIDQGIYFVQIRDKQNAVIKVMKLVKE